MQKKSFNYSIGIKSSQKWVSILCHNLLVNKINNYIFKVLIKKKINFTAAFTFLPLGIVMGNILYFYFTDETTIIFLSNIQFWPFFAAGALALVTATIMTYRKLKAKKYEFEHFYYMTFGMFFVLLGGNLLLNTNGKIR